MVRILYGTDLYPDDGNTCDPYCYIIWPDGKQYYKEDGEKLLYKTETQYKRNDVVWRNNTFHKKIKVKNKDLKFLQILVMDEDILGDDLIGNVKFLIE